LSRVLRSLKSAIGRLPDFRLYPYYLFPLVRIVGGGLHSREVALRFICELYGFPESDFATGIAPCLFSGAIALPAITIPFFVELFGTECFNGCCLLHVVSFEQGSMLSAIGIVHFADVTPFHTGVIARFRRQSISWANSVLHFATHYNQFRFSMAQTSNSIAFA
jgi:hypothetical protein